MSEMIEGAATFASLHQPGEPLVLPCVWEVTIAKLLAQQGFAAVGTTSLGVAAAGGLRDEDRSTRERTRELATTIRDFVPTLLLTCDIEDGYSDDPEEVAAFVSELDVQGVNIEDSLGGTLTDPHLLVQKIRAVKAAAPHVFINARVDTYWNGISSLAETRRRLDLYVEAGADGIFVPGDLDLTVVNELAHAYRVPLNVLASARHTRSALADAGVSRISTGSLLYRGALSHALTLAAQVSADELPATPGLGYAAIQQLTAEVSASAD